MSGPLDVWISLYEATHGGLYVKTSLQGPWEGDAPNRIAVKKIRIRAPEGIDEWRSSRLALERYDGRSPA